MVWKEQPLQRDDDPYHVWAYQRDQVTDHADDGYCLVVVLVKADGSKALLKSLEWMKEIATADDGEFLMSPSDLEHLDRVVARREALGTSSASDTQNPITDYERLYVVYVPETLLFPKKGTAMGGAFSKHLDILYRGRPFGAAGIERLNFAPDAQKTGDGSMCLAIIDDSFAFLNNAFTTAEGTNSLFDRIWFQKLLTAEERSTSEPLSSGAQISATDINMRLRQLSSQAESKLYADPFVTASSGTFYVVDPTTEQHQPLSFEASHGTFVAATALRSFQQHAGSLDRLSLFGVSLPTEVSQDTSGSSLGSYFVAALRQVMLWADDFVTDEAVFTPLVINFSYGFTAGPKDGSDPLNLVIQRMIDGRNAAGRTTAMVVPMGNSYQDRGMAEVTLKPGEAVDPALDLSWVLPPDDRTSSFLEIIAVAETDKPVSFDLGLTAPHSTATQEVTSFDGHLVGKAKLLYNGDEQPESLVASCSEWAPQETSTWARRAFVALAPTANVPGQPNPQKATATAGRWKLSLKNTSEVDITLQISVQRDDVPGSYPLSGRQSFLDAADSHDVTGEFDTKDELFPETATLTHKRTASVLASNRSDAVYAIGAGIGAFGDQEPATAVEPSWYTSAGPLRGQVWGPYKTEVADRSWDFPGIYRASTFSDAPLAFSGSSIAAPRFAGWLAANNGVASPKPVAPEPTTLRGYRFA